MIVYLTHYQRVSCGHVNENGTVTERRVTASFGAVLIFALDEATSAALSAISGLPALPVTPCRWVDDTVSAWASRMSFVISSLGHGSILSSVVFHSQLLTMTSSFC
jgi:hypothetical protein